MVRFQIPTIGMYEPEPGANRPGLRHIALKVDDRPEIVDRIQVGWKRPERLSTTRTRSCCFTSASPRPGALARANKDSITRLREHRALLSWDCALATIQSRREMVSWASTKGRAGADLGIVEQVGARCADDAMEDPVVPVVRVKREASPNCSRA